MVNWALNGKIYSEIEMYTKWLATCTAGILSIVPEIWWGSYLASVTVLLAWMELLLFYAMNPKWGLYILMFFEVVTNVFQVRISRIDYLYYLFFFFNLWIKIGKV